MLFRSNEGDTFTIHYTANDGYLIESLTSNIGTVTIADNKKSAVLTGSATENIVVEGVAKIPATPTYTYTETLQNIVSDGATSYNEGDTFTIHYTANDGYLIESLTSNIGTVTIADDKRSAVLAGSATENIVVEGVATEYGTILITGSFVHCSCNYSNGETISPSKPRLEIVADDGFIFLNVFRYKQEIGRAHV